MVIHGCYMMIMVSENKEKKIPEKWLQSRVNQQAFNRVSVVIILKRESPNG